MSKPILPILLLSSVCWFAGCSVEKPEIRPEIVNGSFLAELNGFRIHYEIHGTGPVLMVVPNSWGIEIPALRSLYRGLEKKLTLVYFDPRGMGKSDPIQVDSDMGMGAVRQDFNALRQHLGLKQVFATGWSNGAVNLIQLATEYPDTFSSLVFVHGVATYSEEDAAEFAGEYPQVMQSYSQFVEQVNSPDLTDSVKNGLLGDLWLDELLPHTFADPDRAEEFLEKVFGETELSWKHMMYSNQEVSTFDHLAELAEISIPCLVIGGRHDFHPEKAEEMQQGLQDARLVLFERSGHFSPLEEAVAFEAEVFEFLGVQ